MNKHLKYAEVQLTKGQKTMTKLEEIRQAVIAANPEIVELKFGCQVEYQENIWNVAKLVEKAILLVHIDGIRVTRFGDYEGAISKYNIRIIGRPIRLADVLLAIGCDKDEEESYPGEGKEVAGRILGICGFWNLREDDLSKQSGETINFIHQLLFPHA